MFKVCDLSRDQLSVTWGKDTLKVFPILNNGNWPYVHGFSIFFVLTAKTFQRSNYNIKLSHSNQIYHISILSLNQSSHLNIITSQSSYYHIQIKLSHQIINHSIIVWPNVYKLKCLLFCNWIFNRSNTPPHLQHKQI